MNGQLGFADADTTLCNPANRGPAGAPAVGLAPSQAFVPEAAQAPQLGFGPNVAFAPAVRRAILEHRASCMEGFTRHHPFGC